jgi:integrase
MAGKITKTRTPGIFKRGSRYVFSYRVNGKQRWESCRTLEEARRAKQARETDITRGEFDQRYRITFHEYLRDWVERYQGTGRRGYRQETRDEDRQRLDRYALRYFPASLRLSDVTPSAIAGYVGWLCDGPAQAKNAHEIRVARARAAGASEPPRLLADAKRELADSTVRNALKPVRSALATARREGLIRHNPASEVALPHRGALEEDGDRARPFPTGVMSTVVASVPPGYRVMLELLAATGVRRSELFALELRHLNLRGPTPRIKVRQRVRRRSGAGLVVCPLKSRYARRDLPITPELAERLRSHVGGRGQHELVFASRPGTVLDPSHITKRVLTPACTKGGAGWAGFHTFRHTVASRLFAEGRNAVQVQRRLGHHSPAFTLGAYVHLFDPDLGAPLPAESANKVQTGTPPLDGSAAAALEPESAL